MQLARRGTPLKGVSGSSLFSKSKDWVLYWRLSIIRCIIYATIVSWGMFTAGTEGYDTLSDMTDLQKLKLIGNMVFAGFAGVVLAFLDQTLTQIRQSRLEPTDNENTTPRPPAADPPAH